MLYGCRAFFIAEDTFVRSGSFTGRWRGDTNSNWGDMYLRISRALQFSMVGIPYFGVETCGFNGNADLELCTRWMQASPWFPMYRNHHNRNTVTQEAYRWAITADRIMNIRYSLLPYTYTLFYGAKTADETVLRALAWELPDEPQLKDVETQFMSGPAILVKLVLEPLATTVKGVFPGVATGTVWYDWYTLEALQPIHIRGGYMVPYQSAGNTTATSRKSPWDLLVALDNQSGASGEVYLDDGLNLSQTVTKMVTSKVKGNFNDRLPLANVTIVGIKTQHSKVLIKRGGKTVDSSGVVLEQTGEVLRITNLGPTSRNGVWRGTFWIRLMQDFMVD